MYKMQIVLVNEKVIDGCPIFKVTYNKSSVQNVFKYRLNMEPQNVLVMLNILSDIAEGKIFKH